MTHTDQWLFSYEFNQCVKIVSCRYFILVKVAAYGTDGDQLIGLEDIRFSTSGGASRCFNFFLIMQNQG